MTAETGAVIWIVDDSPLQARICQSALSPEHDVVVFDDPAALLVALSDAAPDVLLLDWYMPGLSGLEVLGAVRAQNEGLPILVLTAENAGDELASAFNAGATDFLVKAYSKIELVARVNAALRAKRLHDRLKLTEAALREEAAFRERFMGVLAHDLRQPLHMLKLGSQTVNRLADEGQRARVLERMTFTVSRMSRLIDELLDFTRARSSHGVALDPQEMRLDSLAQTIVDEFAISNPGEPIELVVEGDCSGVWDEDRLAQVCANLISNAIHHGTPSGGISIRVTGGDRVQLTVGNRGLTIPPTTLETIFNAFQQGQTRIKQGLGLGLFIVKAIVEAHGGNVTVVSEDGLTVFTVLLPRHH